MTKQRNDEKRYDCPFCGSKDAIWNGGYYTISYCTGCGKVLIVLNNAKSTDFVSDLMLRFVSGLKGDF